MLNRKNARPLPRTSVLPEVAGDISSGKRPKVSVVKGNVPPNYTPIGTQASDPWPKYFHRIVPFQPPESWTHHPIHHHPISSSFGRSSIQSPARSSCPCPCPCPPLPHNGPMPWPVRLPKTRQIVTRFSAVPTQMRERKKSHPLNPMFI